MTIIGKPWEIFLIGYEERYIVWIKIYNILTVNSDNLLKNTIVNNGIEAELGVPHSKSKLSGPDQNVF